MSLDNYFETLKLTTGACEFTLVEDRAVRRSISPPRKDDDPKQCVRDALRTSASKFTMEECDEPLFRPTRRLSFTLGSSGTDTSEDEFPSIDSMKSLNTFLSSQSLSIDETDRLWGSDSVPSAAKTADSRWAFPKNHDYPLHHSRVSTGITNTRMQAPYARTRSI